jgi:hypothetical protein
MKRLRWISVAAMVVLLIAGSLAFAQGRAARRGGPGGPFPGGPAGIPLRGLDLSDAQRDQIRDIVQRYQQQMRTDILLVLTPEQQEKAKQLEAKQQARMKQRLDQMQQRLQQRQAQ